jgi:D-alanyl-D-alanine dipeptidase
MILLDNEKIRKVKNLDKNEYFVNLNNINEKIFVDNSKQQIASKSKFFCYCRQSVADLLIESTKYLPTGILYCIKEAYRPLSVQKNLLKKIYSNYKEQYINLNEKKLLKKLYEYVAPLDVAPHPTGAAIDIVLIDNNGIEVNMGTKFNAEPIDTKNKTYTYNKLLTKEEKGNRRILIKALEKVGFVNYPSEWWHWSYGDKYWGYIKGKKAVYNQIEEEEIKIL